VIGRKRRMNGGPSRFRVAGSPGRLRVSPARPRGLSARLPGSTGAPARFARRDAGKAIPS